MSIYRVEHKKGNDVIREIEYDTEAQTFSVVQLNAAFSPKTVEEMVEFMFNLKKVVSQLDHYGQTYLEFKKL